MIVIKQIKAAKLRSAAMWYELQAAVEKVGKEIQADFEKTTATWEHQPKFEVETDVSENLAAMVSTDDKIFGYVDEGTRPHVIRAKNGKRLAFQWAGPGSYRAKTSPGVIGSTAGGPSGEMVYPVEVHHPGTKARHFDKMIRQKWEPRFKQRMEYAMRKAAKASGHGG
jgi:hypothetical protein